jgi:hypothetical protein
MAAAAIKDEDMHFWEEDPESLVNMRISIVDDKTFQQLEASVTKWDPKVCFGNDIT